MGNDTAKDILLSLKNSYPSAKCELNFSSPFQLLVATILSAQCTDKRVNEVTKSLFARFPGVEDFASLSYDELGRHIYSCGFYKNKSKNIVDCAKMLLEKHKGAVPQSLEELMLLPGVGRKTANVVISNAFGQSAIAVDTHVFRVSRRLGLSSGANELKVEMDLQSAFDKNDWSIAHHLLIFHGRYCCHSRKPECARCSVADLCKYDKKEIDIKG